MKSKAGVVIHGLIAAVLFGATALPADDLPKAADEELVALLNCGTGEAPADWKPVAQWTFPGRFPKRLTLRAYHAVSFGGGKMNVDYMVCHLGWYNSEEEAQAAYASEPVQGKPIPLPGRIGERAFLGEGELVAPLQPRQVHYDMAMQRGSFLFRAGVVAVSPWPAEKLFDLIRSVDRRLTKGSPDPDARETSAKKGHDPRRPPPCDRTCWVHGESLRPVQIPIVYGLPSPVEPGSRQTTMAELSREYWDAKRTQFPNAPSERVEGGCIVDELLTHEWFCACPICASLQAEWRRDHNYPVRP